MCKVAVSVCWTPFRVWAKIFVAPVNVKHREAKNESQGAKDKDTKANFTPAKKRERDSLTQTAHASTWIARITVMEVFKKDYCNTEVSPIMEP